MKTLKTYLADNRIDGHIHLFDHSGTIGGDLIRASYKCVCFADVAFRHIDEYADHKIVKYYEDFITNDYDPSKHILLATADNSEDIIEIYRRFPQYIKGFGELKCYSEWKEGPLPYGNLQWIRPLMEFNRGLKLPVYIHFNLDSIEHRDEFVQLLKDYADIPIVLCHCGMVKKKAMNSDIFEFVRSLMLRYSNLYVDISKKESCSFFISNLNKLLMLPNSRLIVGTDINPIIQEVINDPKRYSDECYRLVNRLHKYIDNSAVSRLFNLTSDKCDRLIKLYQTKLADFNRHQRIHLLSRGHLIGMYNRATMIDNYKDNVKALDEIMNLYENDLEALVDKYVLIGYTEDRRKRNIGKLFKKSSHEYKQYLGLVSLLETVYTFKRVGLLSMINRSRINRFIDTHKDVITSCIVEDRHNYKQLAATKYINSLFFIYNLKNDFRSLKNVVPDTIYDEIINAYIELYNDDPTTTVLYGITHILIGASDFYVKRPDAKYDPLIEILNKTVDNKQLFYSFNTDLQMEILLCCKLFGVKHNIDMSHFIKLTELSKYEHTNMLYILLSRYNLD